MLVAVMNGCDLSHVFPARPGIGAPRLDYQLGNLRDTGFHMPELLGKLSASDREIPAAAEINGTLMARPTRLSRPLTWASLLTCQNKE
jgi:hypothetical protein